MCKNVNPIIFKKTQLFLVCYEKLRTFAMQNKTTMNFNEQTLQQVDRVIRKIAEKFPSSQEASVLTDIHLRVSQDTGEILVLDDDGNEVTRCVVEQWIDEKSDNFCAEVAGFLRKQLAKNSSLVDAMSILKPYSFVLETDEDDEQHELYVVDDDTVIIDPEIMSNLDEELDSFFEELMKKE